VTRQRLPAVLSASVGPNALLRQMIQVGGRAGGFGEPSFRSLKSRSPSRDMFRAGRPANFLKSMRTAGDSGAQRLRYPRDSCCNM
jgi:hypothetical protein